ncbi:hypothetical protein Q9295_10045 [Xinfangfangia sp. CPCC 101601]|uniref:Branched-chain amino acid ABC transporter permease n=1 Tax=Pseudogemmobacter lacusdianii TaxID=3069608 RepID=A0ABU0VYV4_9RHOB|nr:hypothetical protein [Xinfangfangia sp. CPCC 101601]MDQ2066718.1 hypothetical protein [Xinfangfangia sp. CPCC 101601]
MPEYLKNPWVYGAMALVGLQFTAGMVMDVILGAAMVGIVAYQANRM